MRLQLAPSDVDIDLYNGDGATILVTVQDASGNAMNVTGTVIAQIRQRRNDSAPILSFAVDLSLSSSGKIMLSLTGAQTASLLSGTADPWRGFWDVQWTASGGQPLTLVQGAVECDLDVSR